MPKRPSKLDPPAELERFLAAVQAGLADSQTGKLIDDEILARELDQLEA